MPSLQRPLLLYLSSVQQESFPSLDLQGLQAALPGPTLARRTRLASDLHAPASCLPGLGVKSRRHARPALGTKPLPHRRGPERLASLRPHTSEPLAAPTTRRN